MLHSITATLHHYRGGQMDLSPYLAAYSEQHTLSAFPVFSFKVPARIGNTPTQQIIQKSDLLEVSLRNGKREATTFIGTVRGANPQTVMTSNGLEDVITYMGSSISGYLMSSVLNWYNLMGGYYGKQGIHSIVPSSMQFMLRLDEAIKNMLEYAIFKLVGLETPFGNTEDLLGYALHSLGGLGKFDIQLASYESTGWKMLEAYTERPLHELYSRFVSSSQLASFNGIKRPGKTFGKDQVCEVIVFRPSPFPSTDGLSEWSRLPLHDLGLLAPQSINLSSNDQRVVNMTHLTGKGLMNDGTSDVTFAQPVNNPSSRKRYGHKAMGWQTFLSNQDAAKEDMPSYFKKLNFRLASQHNQLQDAEQGTIPLGLEPQISVGERIRFQKRGDNQFYQGYITGLNHNISESSAMTNLTVDRVYPESVYQSEGYFIEGLQEMPIIGDDPIPDADVYNTPGPTRN